MASVGEGNNIYASAVLKYHFDVYVLHVHTLLEHFHVLLLYTCTPPQLFHNFLLDLYFTLKEHMISVTMTMHCYKFDDVIKSALCSFNEFC